LAIIANPLFVFTFVPKSTDAMRNFLIYAILFFAINTTMQAQVFWRGERYVRGQKDLHLGVGLLPTYYGAGYKLGMLPVSLTFEVGVRDDLGVSGMVAYSSARTPAVKYQNGTYWYQLSTAAAGLRVAHHFELSGMDRFDIYAGGIAGARMHVVTFQSTDPKLEKKQFDDALDGIRFMASAFGGARWQATKFVRIYGEVGYGMSWLTMGLHLRLSSGRTNHGTKPRKK
jgi:hypothetical protein